MTASSWKALRRSRVVVNLVTGRAFEGILWKVDGPLLILREVQLLENGSEAMRVDGEVVVERRHVEFVQITGTLRSIEP